MANKSVWRDYLVTWKDRQDQTHKATLSIVSPGEDYIKSLNIQYIRRIRVKSIIDIKLITRR